MSDLSELSDKQTLAIEHLLNGKGVTATSEAVGVSRQTVHEWQRQPLFQHELAVQRAERQEMFRERWQRMSDKVNVAMESALDADDFDTRLKAVSLWLKHQAPTPEPLPPFDPIAAAVQFARDELRREVEREFTLTGRRWRSQTALEELLAKETGRDYVAEEVRQRLPDRLRELGWSSEARKPMESEGAPGGDRKSHVANVWCARHGEDWL